MKRVDVETAIAALPDHEYVHTFLGGFGADWGRSSIEDLIRDAGGAVLTDGLVAALGHRIAVRHPNPKSGWLAIQTRADADLTPTGEP